MHEWDARDSGANTRNFSGNLTGLIAKNEILTGMKKIMTLLLLTTFCISALSQQKPKKLTVGTSGITKKDKLIDNFKIKNKKYNVYLGYIEPSWALQQEKEDTLLVYKIVAEKYKYSELEINKYATRNGKIIRESFYNIKSDTLTVITNFYDYYNADCIIDKYIIDKYGLKKISDIMKGIDTQNLSDKYLKPAEMKVPPSAKN